MPFTTSSWSADPEKTYLSHYVIVRLTNAGSCGVTAPRVEGYCSHSTDMPTLRPMAPPHYILKVIPTSYLTSPRTNT